MDTAEIQSFFHSRMSEELLLAPNRTEALGIGQRIIDIVKELIGSATSGLNVDEVIAVAKQFYDQLTAGDNPSIPNFLEPLAERIIWNLIEGAIRRLLQQQPPAPQPI